MPRIFYWNVNKKDVRTLVCDAVKDCHADAVVLLENSVTAATMLTALREKVSDSFFCPRAVVGRFQVFSRDAALDLREVYWGDRVTIRRMHDAKGDLLLGAVHVVDKMNWDQANQQAQVQLLSAEVRRCEQEFRNDRTVLIGDFNMNPFEQAMNLPAGMNSMMTRKCVQAGSRIQQEKEYPFFYNPMWSLFGDRTSGPAGTYYHAVSSRGNYGWNMLDQVLVRPAAIDHFQDVEIVVSAGDKSLQTHSGRPNRAVASDHFPLLLQLA